MSFDDWDAVRAFALTLPDTYVESFYGRPAPKVNKNAFVSKGGKPGSLHVRSPHDEKAVLIDTEPATFWQTPHCANWPGPLVRYGSADPERIALVIRRAWWDLASARKRTAYAPRP